MARPAGRPTYQALLRAMKQALECLDAVAAHVTAPARVRFRVIRCADRLRSMIARANGTS